MTTANPIGSITRIDRPEGRTYLTPSGEFKSVNTILDATASEEDRTRLEKWKAKNPNGSEDACNRGTIIHEAIAKYLEHGDLPEALPDEIALYWNSIYPWLKLTGETATVEHPVYGGHRLGLELEVYHGELGYAGTLDRVGSWERGSPLSLMDFKTSHRKKQKKWLKRARLQCAAYRLAYRWMFGIEVPGVVIPVAIPSGIAQVFELSAEEVAEDEAEWLERLREFRGA